MQSVKLHVQSKLLIQAIMAMVLMIAVVAGASANETTKTAAGETDDSIMGFTPLPGSIPNFACTDDSYAKAKSEGLTLGIVNVSPYTVIRNKVSDYTGIDWDIWQAVLKYIGINKVKYSVQSWNTMVPALTSGRIDVIAGNFHATKERVKKIAFTAPAWWYGPAIVVPKGNPAHITSFKQLGDHNINVGVLAGSNTFLYLADIGANVTPYQAPDQELASLAHGHGDAVVEDAPVAAEFMSKRPDAGLEILDVKFPKDAIIKFGFGYARYGVRKTDCTLNFAVSRALSELRSQGVIRDILAKYGLKDNVSLPYAK